MMVFRLMPHKTLFMCSAWRAALTVDYVEHRVQVVNVVQSIHLHSAATEFELTGVG